MSESILEFSYSISLTDDILSAGHERTLVIRCHRSKRGQVFFKMVVADLYTETISMQLLLAMDRGVFCFVLELRPWEVIFRLHFGHCAICI